MVKSKEEKKKERKRKEKEEKKRKEEELKRKVERRREECAKCGKIGNIDEWNKYKGDTENRGFCNDCVNGQTDVGFDGERLELFKHRSKLRKGEETKLEKERLEKERREKERDDQLRDDKQELNNKCQKCGTVKKINEWNNDNCNICLDGNINNDLKNRLKTKKQNLLNNDVLEEEARKRTEEKERLRLAKLNEDELKRLEVEKAEKKRLEAEKKEKRRRKKKKQKERKRKEKELQQKIIEEENKNRLADKERKEKERISKEKEREEKERIAKIKEAAEKRMERKPNVDKRFKEFGMTDIKKINKQTKKYCNNCQINYTNECQKCLASSEDNYINEIYKQNCNKKCRDNIRNLSRLE